jgi:hypothetical protein
LYEKLGEKEVNREQEKEWDKFVARFDLFAVKYKNNIITY